MSQMPPPSVAAMDEAEAQIDLLVNSGTELDAHEGRRFPRFHYQSRIRATVYPFNDGASAPLECTMLTRDLSRGGINLLHTDPLLLGQKIALTLSESGPRFVEVMWCRRVAHRCYSLGCRFIRVGGE
jgi:hypothetical protein